MNRDDIKLGVIHCSATKPSQVVTAGMIDEWHRARGWSGLGYHCIIDRKGVITEGRTIGFKRGAPGDMTIAQGAHVAGWNRGSIAICLVGGLDGRGRSIDVGTEPDRLFTSAQLSSLETAVEFYTSMFLGIRWIGHRDVFDTDGDGVASPGEWLKTCPGFDVAAFLAIRGLA